MATFLFNTIIIGSLPKKFTFFCEFFFDTQKNYAAADLKQPSRVRFAAWLLVCVLVILHDFFNHLTADLPCLFGG
jgi:hypothetical protein